MNLLPFSLRVRDIASAADATQCLCNAGVCMVAMPITYAWIPCAQTVETAAVPAVAKAVIREQLAAVQKALIEQAKKAGAAAKVCTC